MYVHTALTENWPSTFLLPLANSLDTLRCDRVKHVGSYIDFDLLKL